eukprot:SAG22_NODE_4893_length_1138_cov_4.200192_1_plen_27_part_10
MEQDAELLVPVPALGVPFNRVGIIISN